MHDIKISLAIEEANLILEALGNLPFARVYALVGKIQEQAASQVKSLHASSADPAPAQVRGATALR